LQPQRAILSKARSQRTREARMAAQKAQGGTMKAAALSALLAAMLNGASAAEGQDDADRLHGWWRATATHAGESKDVYLHFEDRDGKPFVRFSIPSIAADDSPLGPYRVDGDKVNLPAAGWSFALVDSATALSGTIPSDIAPVYNLRVRFERSAPPTQPVAVPSTEAPRPLWRAQVPGAVFGPLAYDRANRAIIVGTDSGIVSSLADADGRLRWTAKLGAPIRSAPAVGADAVYVATDKAVWKLRKPDGTTIWSTAFTGAIPPRRDMTQPDSRWDHYGSSVVLADGLAVAGSRDGCVYALRQSNGAVRKRICSKDVVASTPVVAGGRVYFSSFDEHLHAADLKTGGTPWTADLKAPAPGDLALVGGRILAGSRTYDLTAHDPATGKVAWTNYFWFSWIDSAPVEDRGQILVGSSDALRLFALDPATGRTKWSSFIGGWAWARPAAGRRTIYAGAVGAVAFRYLGPRGGALAAIDRKDGRLKWLFRAPHDAKAQIAGFASGPLVSGGRVFAADLEGNVYAFAGD
jgi:outer membrane protein assembly factor BamB